MVKGHIAYGCRKCNWDACEDCFEEKTKFYVGNFVRVLQEYFQHKGLKYLSYEECKAEAKLSDLEEHIFNIVFKDEKQFYKQINWSFYSNRRVQMYLERMGYDDSKI